MIITRAPLRIPLGGGGTDFASYYNKYGGYLLGFACNLYVYVVIHPILEPKIHLKYSKNEVVEATEEGLDRLENRIAAEAIRYIGLDKLVGNGGLEVATFSDVPESSGLGGSSSFVCSLLLGLKNLAKPYDYYSPDRLFGDAFHVERELAGIPGGMQDQFFAAKGGASVVVLSKESTTTSDIDLSGFIENLYLVYTNSTRTSLDIATNQIDKTENLDTHMINSLDKVKEIGYRIEDLIHVHSYVEVAQMFTTHWKSKMDRDPGIVTPEMYDVWDSCVLAGALGGKLIGLGGGGYFLMYSLESLESIGGIPVDIAKNGAELVLRSNREEVSYAL